MIARTWRGAAEPANANRYVDHLRAHTLPVLSHIPGYCGGYVMRHRHTSGSRVEFMVVTLWESLDAIRAFAGADTGAAVVPAEARALLASYDDRAVHWDVVLDNSPTRGAK
ncbi:MAG TPA: antibiotic biosynthesis monooxygenase [Vicinamibacterales bacterium]